MKDKIIDILNKIDTLIETEYQNDKFVILGFRGSSAPKRKRELLHELFPVGSPTELDIRILEQMLEDSKKQAINYNNPKLVIGDEDYSKAIILYYDETEQEILKRLTNDYNRLLEKIKRDKDTDEEHKKFLELKLKYEPNVS